MKTRAAIGFMLGSVCVAACSSAPEAPSAQGAAQLEKAPPVFVDGKGQRWTRGRAAPISNQGKAPPAKRPEGGKGPENFSRDELVAKLRPVAMYEGYEYTLESSDIVHAMADAALRMKGQVVDYPANTGSAPTRQVDETKRGTHVIGSDDRYLIRGNTDYPYRTQVFLWGTAYDNSCSGTMIGASTMVTAAHCLSDGYNWFSTRMWSPGADGQDWPQFAYDPWGTYPSSNPNQLMVSGCYWNSIPQGWWDSGGSNVDYDFATIEFSYTCGGLYPGNTVGWLGWGSQYDSWIDDNYNFSYGYPGGDADDCGGATGCAGGPCYWPSIWGHGNVTASSYSTTVHYDLDMQPGQSGSGIYNYVQGFPKVIAIHHGCLDNFFWTTNYGRRITSSTISFIQATTAL